MNERHVGHGVPLLERRETAQTFIEHSRRIHAFIRGQIRREFRDALPQLPHRSRTVRAAFVIKRHREVNNRLQKPLSGRLLSVPDIFENIVTRVKLARVEERNAPFETSLHATFQGNVFRWLKRKQDEAPLTGAPAQPRMKTYSAQSGYVYQYAFRGQRPAATKPSGIEYAFDVTYDRKTMHRLWVFVADAAVAAWIDRNGRDLTNSERYGVAKIALRNAFDDRAPSAIHDRIAPAADEVITILEELGV